MNVDRTEGVLTAQDAVIEEYKKKHRRCHPQS